MNTISTLYIQYLPCINDILEYRYPRSPWMLYPPYIFSKYPASMISLSTGILGSHEYWYPRIPWILYPHYLYPVYLPCINDILEHRYPWIPWIVYPPYIFSKYSASMISLCIGILGSYEYCIHPIYPVPTLHQWYPWEQVSLDPMNRTILADFPGLYWRNLIFPEKYLYIIICVIIINVSNKPNEPKAFVWNGAG